jgi:hypothetical protein
MSGRQPVGNGPAIGVERLAQFPAQAGELHISEQAPIARLLASQVAGQALPAVGLGVAVHAAPIRAQYLRNRRGDTALI